MRRLASRQWAFVGVTLAVLGAGVAALIWVGGGLQGVEVGRKAPDFSAIDLRTGDSVSLRAGYAGSVTLVNIWATWCIPCRTEMPSMQQLFDSMGPQGFKIAAVSIDEGNSEDVAAFGRQLSLTFDILHDKSGRVQRVYQTTGVPESFLLDRRGLIVKRLIGPQDWNSDANRMLVRRLLDEKSS
jgi:cytochrome c biogenesis protein CcmG, thiol:disulfide interchange protein DsbE